MSDLTRSFDGLLTLAQTQSACEAEQQYGHQLRSINAGIQLVGNEALPVNNADFINQLTGDRPDLLFVLIGAEDPARLRAQKNHEGWTFISESVIYVEGVLERVMVFGK